MDAVELSMPFHHIDLDIKSSYMAAHAIDSVEGKERLAVYIQLRLAAHGWSAMISGDLRQE